MSQQERVFAGKVPVDNDDPRSPKTVPINAAGVRTRAEFHLKRLEKGTDIDADYVDDLLNGALTRPLTLAEARYLERCVFDVQGPSNVQEAPKK